MTLSLLHNLQRCFQGMKYSIYPMQSQVSQINWLGISRKCSKCCQWCWELLVC